jgi:carbon-monoxide dehydrogenase large subunit
MSGRVFGQRVKRLEDPALLRGRGRFIDDIKLPEMAHAAFVRSPHPHAAIKGVDVAAALALDGVHAVYALADLMPHLVTERLVVGLPSRAYRLDVNRPALAGDETCHVGEAVAIVVAENRYVAEDAVELVAVDYDPLPAISDCRAALAPGATLVHLDETHNMVAEFDISYGDAEEAFATAPHVFKESIWLHRGGSHSIECRGAVAAHDPVEDLLTLWSSTQAAHTAMRTLCAMLGRDENQVRIITPDVGGGFGPKLVFYPEDVVVSLAALLLGRPVKWIEDRREHFTASTQERDQYWEAEIAVDGEARILAVRGSMVHDHGAYTARGINLAYNSAVTVPLAYEVPSYAMLVRLAVTNKVPVTPVRGAGHPQGTFVIERLLDRVAQGLGLDPGEVRRRNLVAADRMPCEKPIKTRGDMPVILDSGDYPKCQALALERADYGGFPARKAAARAAGRYRGIGFANYVKGTGRGPFESVSIRIGPSGRILVASGAAAMGQSTHTMLAQIVAEQLGGDMENITVVTGDTRPVPMGIGGSASRQAVTAGSSAHLAAIRIRDKALKVAAHLLEASEADLEIEGDEVRVKGVPDMAVKLGEVAHAVAGTPGYALPPGIEPGMEAEENYVIDDMAFANGTQVVELEVDVETGAVNIVNFVVVHDSGTLINPMVVDGQVMGGVAHGIGNALYEWMCFDETGQPQTTTLAECLLITAAEMPPVEIVHMETPTHLNPLGVKGVGECGVVPAAPAIVAAIEDALSPFGVRISHAPVMPGDIVAMIREAGVREAASGPS